MPPEHPESKEGDEDQQGDADDPQSLAQERLPRAAGLQHAEGVPQGPGRQVHDPGV